MEMKENKGIVKNRRKVKNGNGDYKGTLREYGEYKHKGEH